MGVSNRKKSNPIRKWAIGMHKYFNKDDIRMANNHMARFSTLLTIREMQIKITILLPTHQIAKIKNCDNTKYWQVHGKTGSLVHC